MTGIPNERCFLRPFGQGFVASTASIMGDVHLGDRASIWYGSVLRGDDAAIFVGARTNIQDNCVVHPMPDVPTRIGEDVTIGHGAIIHMKSIGDRCLIGMGSILLGDAEIGEESIIAAGAVVKEYAVIPPRSLVVGTPGRVIRQVTDQDLDFIRFAANGYLEKTVRHLKR